MAMRLVVGARKRQWWMAIAAAVGFSALLFLVLAPIADAAMMETRSFSITGTRAPPRNVVSGAITVNDYPEFGYGRIDIQIDGVNLNTQAQYTLSIKSGTETATINFTADNAGIAWSMLSWTVGAGMGSSMSNWSAANLSKATFRVCGPLFPLAGC
ncbi:MAG: hypothetical protein HY681_10620 [Chloroflexi bacterium]|nr:hypothetical protein [Chloroflexota bacterium]